MFGLTLKCHQWKLVTEIILSIVIVAIIITTFVGAQKQRDKNVLANLYLLLYVL